MLDSLLSSPRASLKCTSLAFAFWLATVMIIIALCQRSAQAMASAQQEEVMTNQTIIDFVKEKTSDEIIIKLIQQSKTKFDTSPSAVLKLKQAGVSDAVIQAMMAKEEGQPIASPEPQAGKPQPGTPGETAPAPTGLPSEIGVYVKKDNQWAEIQPEVVNWKTGGVLKKIGSLGIVKGDINGRINGPRSRNNLMTPLEFLVIAPEGVAITEYQFIRLRQQKDAREFRTVTGGVFHQSGGATRDLVPFEGKKIAPRVFSVTFTTLTPGEYGFLPPGAITSSHASASLGKMYTFTLP